VPTLRFVNTEELPPEEREILERLAKRRGTTIEKLSEIWLAQAHWPALVEANINEAAQAFMQIARLPMVTKQAMHVAVSMSNGCDF
jgi:predicted sugar kinase